MPVSGQYCQYEYTGFNIFGHPEKKFITMPLITALGKGPHRIEKKQDA